MFTEYDAESHMKVVREDGYNEGRVEGHNESLVIIDMSKQGKTPEEISELTGIDIDTVKKIFEKLN